MLFGSGTVLVCGTLRLMPTWYLHSRVGNNHLRYEYKVTLWDAVDLKSRGCRNLKRGNTGVPMVCTFVCVRFAGVVSIDANAADAVPLLYCASSFEF